MRSVHFVAASKIFTSPIGRGRIASKEAIRVRGYVLTWNRAPSPGAMRRPLPAGERWNISL
jgi:hypothetical protein